MKTRILLVTVTLLVLAGLFITQQSCYRKFYKVSDTTGTADLASVVSTQPGKYFILRSGNNAFHMQNILLDSNNKTITCTLDRVSQDHLSYLIESRKQGIHYSPAKEGEVLKEVHIYALQDNQLQYGSSYVLDFNKISKIEVLEKDKGRTTTSTIISTAGIAVTVGLIIATIASSNADPAPSPPPGGGDGSCPFISVYNGSEFITQGELYAGSVYPQMARNDYLQLNMVPVSDGKFRLKISNDQQEVQNTDLAELMIITHDKNVQMHVDQDGKLYSISDPLTPVAATTNNRNIVDDVIKQNDDLVYSFDDTSSGMHNNPVQLSFDKKTNAGKAKLILNVRNGFWMDLVFNKMSEGYGTYYPEFVKQQHAKSAEQLKTWRDMQDIPLTVSVLTSNGWQKVQDIVSVGPLAFRDIVVPVNLENIPGDKVQVKLSAGFMFWELDYAVIDFSNDQQYTIEKLLPSKAVDEKGNDVTQLLTVADEQYLVQPVPGTLTTVDYVYDRTVPANKTQTFVLHSKGYYEYVRDFKNKPDVVFLQQFKNPGALSNYSMNLYKKVVNGDFSSIAGK